MSTKNATRAKKSKAITSYSKEDKKAEDKKGTTTS